jgi:formamidopyrimidine-DNA glycosylase
MPELPEVETLRRGLVPFVANKTCLELKFFRHDIRFPIPQDILLEKFKGKVISSITRQGKYLLWNVDDGALVLHLGMSGRITRRDSIEPQEPHTHVILHFSPNSYLHFIDPRRFGCIVWAPKYTGHPLLNSLGPDPFDEKATAKYLKSKAKNSRAPIKVFLMNSKQIAGIGNIYACESLYHAGIRPTRKSGKLTINDWDRLLTCIRKTLEKSIIAGGTTLRDFYNSDGESGYFAIQLSVYGKENSPCPTCKTPIKRLVHSGRSTFYCQLCQKC